MASNCHLRHSYSGPSRHRQTTLQKTPNGPAKETWLRSLLTIITPLFFSLLLAPPFKKTFLSFYLIVSWFKAYEIVGKCLEWTRNRRIPIPALPSTLYITFNKLHGLQFPHLWMDGMTYLLQFLGGIQVTWTIPCAW